MTRGFYIQSPSALIKVQLARENPKHLAADDRDDVKNLLNYDEGLKVGQWFSVDRFSSHSFPHFMK